ncbi:MAG: hypothetical protein Q7S12_04800 [bacterium]|nr:hypothetical protein [bacterium]
MKRVAQFFIILALLTNPLQSFAQNETETLKIKTQIEILKDVERLLQEEMYQEAVGLENFVDKFFVALNGSAIPNKEDITLQLVFFETKLIDLLFKIAITQGVLGAVIDSEAPIDPFVALQILMLSKPPLEFVNDMLPVIRNSLDALRAEKTSLENMLPDNK